MKIKMLVITGIAVFNFNLHADAIFDQLRSTRVKIAAATCNAATFGCATKWEVRAGHSMHIAGSCHYVDKAMDIYGSESCLNAWAVCLSGNPSVLYCYKNWWIGGIVNWADQGKCRPADHQTHLHLQPIFGCKGEPRPSRRN